MAATYVIDIDDDYAHKDSNLEYILENILSDEVKDSEDDDAKKLRDDYNSQLTLACHCDKELEEIRANDYCDDWSYCDHGGNYLLNSYSETPAELVLALTRQREIFFECNSQCKCPRTCKNRRVQYGPRKNLEIFDSYVYESKGLRTKASIPMGAFICEYAGELLTPKIARKRMLENEELGQMNYILCLNEFKDGEKLTKKNCQKTIIDPSRKGNIGRYMNHCCKPNCEIYSIRVDSPVPKVCIFAKRFIEANEELTFHYAGEHVHAGIPIQPTGRVPCLCKSKFCENFLPNDLF